MEPVTKGGRLLGQVLLVAILLAAWELAPRVFGLSPLVLPRLSAVVGAFQDPLTGGGTLWSHMWTTLQEVVAAFLLASTAGIALGVPIGLVRQIREVALPLLTAAFAVPIMVLIPLFLVTLGLGMESKILFGALYAFFPVVFNVAAGTSSVDPLHLDVAAAYGLPPGQRLGKVVLRSAARSTLNGLQVGMAISIIAVMSIEMFGSVAGLGYLIQRAGQRMRIEEVYFLILATLLLAYVLMSALKGLGRLLDVRLESTAS